METGLPETKVRGCRGAEKEASTFTASEAAVVETDLVSPLRRAKGQLLTPPEYTLKLGLDPAADAQLHPLINWEGSHQSLDQNISNVQAALFLYLSVPKSGR